MCRKPQHGFGVITAIMILVILAALAAAVVTLANTQALDEALDITATKTYFAAKSGIEWGAFQALRTTPASCPASATLAPIDSIAVTVNCQLLTANTTEIGTAAIYRITATACNLPTASVCPGNTAAPFYTERRIVALIEPPSDNSPP